MRLFELNLGRISLSIAASGNELEPVLETIETGLELRDDAIELASDGKLCRGLCAEFLCKFVDWLVVRVDEIVVAVVGEIGTAVTGALFGRS